MTGPGVLTWPPRSSALVAVDDRIPLGDGRFVEPDLMLAAPVMLDRHGHRVRRDRLPHRRRLGLDLRIPSQLGHELYEWFDELSADHWDFRRSAERNRAGRAGLTPRQESAAMATAAALGLVQARPPSRQEYDHILILGRLVRACLVQPAYAARLSRAGVTFGNITALDGFRPLGGDEPELAAALGVTAGNEMGAMVQGGARGIRAQRRPGGGAVQPAGDMQRQLGDGAVRRPARYLGDRGALEQCDGAQPAGADRYPAGHAPGPHTTAMASTMLTDQR